MQPPHVPPYRIERLLGVGSFATVWLGYDARIGARVAVKVLAENWSHDLRVRERFLSEGRLLWRLDSPRLVRVHGVGELADGRPYLVMDWADRGSLRERLADRRPPVPTALRLLREIALAVAVLHAHGIVHRDLAPGNVLFRSTDVPGGDPPDRTAPPAPGWPDDERVLVSDLGLAKALAAASGITARAGTPGFMAPEQDSPLSIVDTRTDVYGLGRLGTAMLGAAVPPAVRPVLAKATATAPPDRYPDAAALLAALDAALARRRSALSRGHRRAVLVTAATLVLTVALPAGDDGVGRWQRLPGTARDASGRLAVVLPPGWQTAGSGWAGTHDPAVLVTPRPDRWAADPAVPGAFIGLTQGATPAAYLAGRTHPDCAAQPVRTGRLGGLEWRVSPYTGCGTGKPAIVEAAAVAPDGGLVYAQIAPPAGAGPDFVDTLLSGVRVR